MKPREFHHREHGDKLNYKNSVPSVAGGDQEANPLEVTAGRKGRHF